MRRRGLPSWLMVLVAALTIFTVVSLAGGSSVEDNPAGETAELAERVSPTPQSGGTLKVGIPGPLARLDPHQAVTEAERMVAGALTRALFRFDYSRGLRGAAVRNWEIEDGGKAYLLELEPGLTFTDGTSCDAEAAAYNIERMREVGSPVVAGAWLASIGRVEVIDDLNLRLHLRYPDPNLLFNLSRAEAGLVSPTAVEELGEDFLLRPVGLGPFVVTDRPPSEEEYMLPGPREDTWRGPVDMVHEVHLVRRDDGAGGRPYLDAVTMVHIDDTYCPARLLEAGVDVLACVPPGTGVPEESGYSVVRPNLDHHMLALNLSHPALGDLRVRRALHHAIDRKEVIRRVLGGDAEAMDIGGWPGEPQAAEASPPNLDEAVRLLARAGYGEEEVLSLTMLTDEDPERVAASQLMANQLRDLGIHVDLELTPREEYYERMRAGDYDISYWVVLPQLVDPFAYTGNLRSDNYWNVSCIWRNGELFEVRESIDDLLIWAAVSTCDDERADLHHELSGLIRDNQLYVSLWHTLSRGVAADHVRGLHVSYGYAFSFERTWIVRGDD